MNKGTMINENGFCKKFPEVFRLDISSVCNLSCIHCPSGHEDKKDMGIMDMETFMIILGYIKKYKPRVVVFYHSGEPFLNKNIFQMIKLVKESGVNFTKVVTNGTLITEELIPKIINSGLDQIEFSLDGNSIEENNEIRLGCNYTKVSKIIKTLISEKLKNSSKSPSVVIANTQIPYEKELKIECIAPEYIKTDFAEYLDFIEIKSTYSIVWPAYKNNLKKYKIKTGYSNKNDYCDHPISTITFLWDGGVVPCCYDITGIYKLGNIKEESLEEIWNNQSYKNLRNSIVTKKLIPLCQRCNVLNESYYLVKA